MLLLDVEKSSEEAQVPDEADTLEHTEDELSSGGMDSEDESKHLSQDFESDETTDLQWRVRDKDH